jgi:hypothetical protein
MEYTRRAGTRYIMAYLIACHYFTAIAGNMTRPACLPRDGSFERVLIRCYSPPVLFLTRSLTVLHTGGSDS